ncbi:hypothetical protein D3C85_378110 [compost metagenome]
MNWKDSAVMMAKESGMSWRRIANELNVPKSSVSDHLRKYFKEDFKPSSEHLGPKILFIDVETSPIISHVWSLWNNNVGLNQIEADWHLLSFCAKWHHSDEVIYADQRGAVDIEDDYSLLSQIWELLNEAQIVVGHNLKRFDAKKINARLILNGLPKPSSYRMIDTLEVSKRNFGFTSQKLAYLTDKLCSAKKLDHSKYPGHSLWTACMKGDVEAWECMREYNIMDVISLEELYLILSSWDNKLPNMDVYVDEVLDMSVWEKTDFHYSQLGKYQKYRNKITGQEKRSRVNLLTKEKVASLLTNI